VFISGDDTHHKVNFVRVDFGRTQILIWQQSLSKINWIEEYHIGLDEIKPENMFIGWGYPNVKSWFCRG
jgi:hypothetical protein